MVRLLLLVAAAPSAYCFLPAQDTLISSSEDTLLVTVESLNKYRVRFRRYGTEEPKLEADLRQIKAVRHADKANNFDYYQGEFLSSRRYTRVDSLDLWLVLTTDGNRYIGKILHSDEKSVELETELVGSVTIPRSRIKKMRPLSGEADVRGNRLWLENRHAVRHFWSPSAYGLRRGEGYYQNAWVLFNQVNFGITDHFSMAFGTVPAFLFGASTPAWASIKLSTPVFEDQLNMAGNLLVGTVLGEGTGFGIAYGSASMGSRDRNATLGLGFGLADGALSPYPSITFGGMYRISEKGYLITDNFFFSGGDTNFAIIALGGRTSWPSITLDYGGLIPAGDTADGTVIIPWLGVTINFGQQ